MVLLSVFQLFRGLVVPHVYDEKKVHQNPLKSALWPLWLWLMWFVADMVVVLPQLLWSNPLVTVKILQYIGPTYNSCMLIV